MGKKLLPVLLVLAAASLFLAFKSLDGGNNMGSDNPKSKFSRVLRNVGILLEEGHYSPKKLNDDFSRLAFNKFQEELDGDKNIFLQSDIDGFKKFANRLDDEIRGSELQSFFCRVRCLSAKGSGSGRTVQKCIGQAHRLYGK